MRIMDRHIKGHIAGHSARVCVASLVILATASRPAFANPAQEIAAPANETAVRITIADSPEVTPPVVQQQAEGTCRFDRPMTVEQGEATVRRIAAEEKFDTDLIVAIARQESGFRMKSVSSAGAVGLMQLMPATAKRFGVDICDPDDNVRGAIRYLKLLHQRYQNLLYVLAAYNAGEVAVEQNRGIPLYPETVRYVTAILTDLNGWKPIEARPVKGRKRDTDIQDQGAAGGRRESWSQGFVLHVE